MVEYGLSDRLFAITVVSASNNGTLCCTLDQALMNRNSVWSADAMKVSCLAHVLHLAAQALLHILQVTEDGADNEEPAELNANSPMLLPSSAANDVINTVVKVCICSSALSFIYALSYANT